MKRIQNVCLCVIAKNEAQNLPRLMESVRDLVTEAVVLDTGSSDDTVAVARQLGMYVQEEPWTDFGTARSRSLQLGRNIGWPDWFLVLDCDETLEFQGPREWPEVEDNVVAVMLRGRHLDDDVSWVRHHLLRADLPWRYEGVIHEYATHDGESPEDVVLLCDEPLVRCHDDGVRTRSAKDKAEKFARDAEVLRVEALRDPTNKRTWYYLGQALKDAGDIPAALQAFAARDAFADGSEEHYMACFQAGVLLAEACNPEAEHWMYKAFRMRPSRAEPLVGLAGLWRQRGRVGEAYIAAQRAVWMPRPEAELFYMSDHFWNWGREDELAVCAFKVGKVNEGIEMTQALLARDDVPEEHKERMRRNLSEGERYKRERGNGSGRNLRGESAYGDALDEVCSERAEVLRGP